MQDMHSFDTDGNIHIANYDTLPSEDAAHGDTNEDPTHSKTGSDARKTRETP